jgi:hypothetical protein
MKLPTNSSDLDDLLAELRETLDVEVLPVPERLGLLANS